MNYMLPVTPEDSWILSLELKLYPKGCRGGAGCSHNDVGLTVLRTGGIQPPPSQQDGMFCLLHFLKTEMKQRLLSRLCDPSQNREAQDKSVLQSLKACSYHRPNFRCPHDYPLRFDKPGQEDSLSSGALAGCSYHQVSTVLQTGTRTEREQDSPAPFLLGTILWDYDPSHGVLSVDDPWS